MLDFLKVGGLTDLFDSIPESLRLKSLLKVGDPLSEMELKKFAVELASVNSDADLYAYFLGAGIYDHYIPATVPAILSRSEFSTSYTPYQPEVSQGNLQCIFEFQSLICELTGMEVANASMYDGATALAEAALMASSVTGRKEWLACGAVHPAYLETMRTYAWASDHKLSVSQRLGTKTDVQDLINRISDQTACVVVQNPNFFGSIESLAEIETICHKNGALFVMAFEPISLGILKPPGAFNADICVGEGQPLGIPMGYGGPLLGLFACKQQYIRHMPGRLVGETKDDQGRRGYVLTLQTREQHIRREKATSNICTNEALCALAATVYLSTVGKQGLRDLANLCLQKAHYAADRISALRNCDVISETPFFNEFVVRCDAPISEINERLLDNGIVGGLDLERLYPEYAGHMLVAVTEKRTKEDIDALVGGLAG
jgi:glycine dehydrogenase subunit 1